MRSTGPRSASQRSSAINGERRESRQVHSPAAEEDDHPRERWQVGPEATEQRLELRDHEDQQDRGDDDRDCDDGGRIEQRLLDLLQQCHRFGDAGVLDDAHVEGAVAQREMSVAQRRERQRAEAIFGCRLGDSQRIGIADHHQPRAALQQPRRQGGDGRADEQNTSSVGDGLGVSS